MAYVRSNIREINFQSTVAMLTDFNYLRQHY